MKITISGIPGSGKSTVSSSIAKKYNLVHHNTGKFMRDYAKKHSITIEEVNVLAKKDKKIDDAIDNKLKELNGKEGYIIEGRLGALFCKDNYNILLTVNEDVCAKRISVRENLSYDDALKKLRFRRNEERQRFMDIYGFDYEDESNYDLVVDTSNNKVEDTVAIISKYL